MYSVCVYIYIYDTVFYNHPKSHLTKNHGLRLLFLRTQRPLGQSPRRGATTPRGLARQPRTRMGPRRNGGGSAEAPNVAGVFGEILVDMIYYILICMYICI